MPTLILWHPAIRMARKTSSSRELIRVSQLQMKLSPRATISPHSARVFFFTAVKVSSLMAKTFLPPFFTNRSNSSSVCCTECILSFDPHWASLPQKVQRKGQPRLVMTMGNEK